jgi:hypothetical protein
MMVSELIQAATRQLDQEAAEHCRPKRPETPRGMGNATWGGNGGSRFSVGMAPPGLPPSRSAGMGPAVRCEFAHSSNQRLIHRLFPV